MNRDNFIDDYWGFESFEEKNDFKIVKDDFGIQNRWGDR